MARTNTCSCGYRPRDDEDLALHLLRAGAFQQVRSNIHLTPDRPHQEPRKESDGHNGVVPPVPKRSVAGAVPKRSVAGAIRDLISPSEAQPKMAEGHSAHVSRLPHIPRPIRDSGAAPFWWLAPLNLGVMAFLGAVVLLNFGPPVVTMLLSGPLAAWADILRWLWAHGEVSLPLAVMLALVVGLPWSRRAITRGVERGLESLGMTLVWGLLVTVGVGVITGAIVIIVVWLIPGVGK